MGIFYGPQTLREMLPNAPEALNTTGVVQRIWGYRPWSIINGVSGCIHHSCSTVPNFKWISFRNVHDVVKVNFTGGRVQTFFPRFGGLVAFSSLCLLHTTSNCVLSPTFPLPLFPRSFLLLLLLIPLSPSCQPHTPKAPYDYGPTATLSPTQAGCSPLHSASLPSEGQSNLTPLQAERGRKLKLSCYFMSACWPML